MQKEFETNTLFEINFYAFLGILLLSTAGSAFLIIPLVMFLDSITSILIISLFGFILGLVMAGFVTQLEHLTKHHHAGLWFVLIAGSIMNFAAIFTAIGLNSSGLGILNSFHAAIIYAISFLIPYLVHSIRDDLRKQK